MALPSARDISAQVARVHILPVRHHSPAAAMAVDGELRALRPRLLLVEGSSDATDLIPLLLAPDTVPPVAILAYRSAGDGQEPRAMADPFCDYSPELAALRTARELSIPARFFDAPAGAFLDARAPQGGPEASTEMLPDSQPADIFQALADELGFSTHDEFWDSRMEMAPREQFLTLAGAYGDMVREAISERRPDWAFDQAREAWMLQQLASALEEGFRPEEIAVVCGAAHAAGLRRGQWDAAEVERLSKRGPVQFAMVPYSFPRLSEQWGYGAGNRAPAFYQEVWDRKGDWDGASLEFLLQLARRMRARGHTLSLADSIEAERLARNLAGMRDKAAVGLEEVQDAAVACYGRGSAEPGRFLAELLVGERVGSVSSQAARTSLQQEFMDQVKRLGLPFSDSPRDLRLNLTSQADREKSAFLHRLNVAEIPFARLGVFGGASPIARKEEGQDPLAQLAAMREKWELRWSPSTDIGLIESSVLGNTLAEVCTRLLRAKLETARSLDAAAAVLRAVVVGRLELMHDETLDRCERASAEDDDFGSLTRACHLLELLAGYQEVPEGKRLLARLGDRVFTRTCLLLPRAGEVADEDAAAMLEAVKLLHQVAGQRRRRGEDSSLLVERLGLAAEADGEELHPALPGLATSLLYLDGHQSDDGLLKALGLRLSGGEEPLRAAQFVEGLLSLNRSVLVRNRAVVAGLTAFLGELEGETFLKVLPVLRRALAGLNRHEMDYLSATIATVLGVDPGEAARAGDGPATPAAQLEELANLDRELGDLFG